MIKRAVLLLLCLFIFTSCSSDDTNVLPETDSVADENDGSSDGDGNNGDEGNGDTGGDGTGGDGDTGDGTTTDPDRYNKEIFTDFETTTVVYGRNTTQGGVTKDLDMDIYIPKGDTETKRPLVILAHGGAFINGSKDQFKNLGLAQMLSKSGYVVASISYRLIDTAPSATTNTIATIQAVADMRAAVRYFRKDNAENNTYKIDVNNIFVGGYSAGAITSLHLGYINSQTELQNVSPALIPLFNSNGGFEGNSGNPGFSSAVKGIINISGAIITTDFIKKEDPIIYSIHGTADATVAFEGSGANLKGSGPIHRKANSEGMINQLKAVENAGHDIIFKCPTCNTEIRDFLFQNLN